jgi:hypothetical protein
MMTVFIPALIAATAGVEAPYLSTARGWLLAFTGGALIAFGLGMSVWTVVLFDRVGEGTHARHRFTGEIGRPRPVPTRPQPDDVEGVLHSARHGDRYGLAVGCSAGSWRSSPCVLIAIRGVEEPHLRRRFGADYEEYLRHVPRWIPRLTAWEPNRTARV